MAEEHHHHTSACGTHEHEGGDEIKDRGMFDFLGKKEEEKPQEEVIVAQFEKVQVSEEPCEKKEEVKEEKPSLIEKLHRSTSSSSSELQPGAETTTPQQIEIRMPEPSIQLEQPLPLQTPANVEAFKYGVKVAMWATTISASASGVITVYIGSLENQTNTPKCKFLAKASLLSMIAAFISGLIIFVLSFIRFKFEGIAIIIKILMIVAIGSTASVVGFGVAFYFQKSGW